MFKKKIFTQKPLEKEENKDSKEQTKQTKKKQQQQERKTAICCEAKKHPSPTAAGTEKQGGKLLRCGSYHFNRRGVSHVHRYVSTQEGAQQN